MRIDLSLYEGFPANFKRSGQQFQSYLTSLYQQEQLINKLRNKITKNLKVFIKIDHQKIGGLLPTLSDSISSSSVI